ncbi:SDR family NAD(P)-dependent oxidoreductase [Micromonospora sp. KC207]|uniref:SDR family NAD(P)-dependent oxidoreductase n=1 Tax=Micromonospora sp. KC207 TaxID=2530377 RepID=UPI001048014B|nr:SDR family NAD(P)-dependent oxidoreductase [Micromonospora sp. KC207]TDC67003.1 SDR family NAD(P)-dependent oxidoreductase [Micromonospora sp. KC207]
MRAVIVGNSDGIGLALTRRLLADGWTVTGLSRSPAPVGSHHVVDVTSPEFSTVLAEVGEVDLCVYAAGVGESLGENLAGQTRALEVNLLGAARTFEAVVPRMLAAGRGHLIGLSSLADTMISAQAPGYAASKAGLTSYLLGLDAALRPRGVPATAVRFGFVDTKMAKSPVTPFKISTDRAADVLIRCIRTRPAIVSYPRRMAAVTGTLGPLLRTAARLRRSRSDAP